MFATLLEFILGLFKHKPVPVLDPIVALPPPSHAPEPEPKAQIPQNPKIYIPWRQKELWAARVEYSYSVWYGDRDLSILVSNPSLAEEFNINLDLLALDIRLMQELHSRQDPLRVRILTEKHKLYSDRCQVRKVVVDSFLKEAKLLNQRYSYWIQHLINKGVVFGVNFDSIKGYVEWRKKHA